MTKLSSFTVCLIVVILIYTGCAGMQQGGVDHSGIEAIRKSLANAKEKIKARTEMRASNIKALDHNDAAAKQAGDADLDEAFHKMLDYCRPIVSKYEHKANYLQYSQATVAVIGAIAGGIVVPALTAAAPAANAAWISAFGGVSGAANAGQQALTGSGMTPEWMLQTRDQILKDWKSQINDYFTLDSSTPENQTKRAVSIEKAWAACTLYSIAIPTNSQAQPPAGASAN
jgi:hypothetical protein